MQIPGHWPKLELRKQARQINMRISVNMMRIRVSGPLYVRENELIQFALEHAEWINKTLNRIAKKSQPELPEEASKPFLFLGGKWIPFEIITHASNSVLWDKQKEQIIAKIPFNPNETPLAELKTSLYQYFARTIIPREFREFAQRNGLSYERVFIRSQKTKWGTCSSKKNLSFNYRLIKCPVEIRYYLYAHEAAHLFHLNHSKSFWNKVLEFDSEYREHEAWLKKNESFLFLAD